MPASTTLADAIKEAMCWGGAPLESHQQHLSSSHHSQMPPGPSQYLSVAEIEQRILAMGNCPTLKKPGNLHTSISNYLRNNQSSKEGGKKGGQGEKRKAMMMMMMITSERSWVLGDAENAMIKHGFADPTLV